MSHPGSWNDGRSARRVPVRVRLFGRRLVVTDADRDRAVAELPLEGLALAEEIYAGQPVRLKHRDWPDARLTLEDHNLVDKLIAAAPHLRRRYHGSRGPFYRVMLWGGALVATVAALMGAVHLGAGPVTRMVPLAWEERLASTLMADFERIHGACAGQPGADYVQELVDEIAAQADTRYEFRVRILESDAVNAFALPGGRLAVFRGLLREADGPNEVAGVLAHEVAHGVERHPTEQLVRRSGYGVILSLITGDASGFGALAGDAVGFMANMAHSRAAEAEADRTAMALLNAAGLDSRGLPRFFGKLEAASGSMPEALELLSSHPTSRARMTETRSRAREGRDALTPGQWEAVLASCVDT
ncbi:MAG: M48 family metallopeptidase [Pseudomonadota bacterium]